MAMVGCETMVESNTEYILWKDDKRDNKNIMFGLISHRRLVVSLQCISL